MLSVIKPEQTRHVTQAKIYEGVDARDVAEIAELLGVTQKTIAELLCISMRAIQNRRRAKDNEKLDRNASERVLRMRELMSVAVSYFGTQECSPYARG